jgi:hypothetical protein
MKRLTMLIASVFFGVFVSAAYSQSLADLANKEKERRAEIKDNKVITEEEAAKYKSGPENAVNADAEDASGKQSSENNETAAAAKPSTFPKTDPDEPVDFQGRPESYWRTTMAEARRRVTDLENEKNVLVLKLNDLQTQFYREDDGFKREGIQREIQKTFYEQDQNKENLEKAKNSLQDLENEARKSGALPGWIAARNP